MKLKQLFQGVDGVVIKGNRELEIATITANSKTASPGSLFVAKRGLRGDGIDHMREAIRGGSIAILTDTYNPFLSVTQIVCPDVKQLEPSVGNRFYDNPSQKLALIGVTGTSGKTTTTFLIRHLLDQCGLIGTVNWITGKRVLPASHTTPDLLTLLQLLKEMHDVGCKAAAVEVSSHAIDQRRIADIRFAAAVFTNLSQDHLDYHGTMDNYAAVKRELFKMSKEVSIINGDDPWADFMIEGSSSEVIRYGFSPKCQLIASNATISPHGMRFDIDWHGIKKTVQTSLVGRFNIYNLLAAIAVALHQGALLEEVTERIATFSGVPGRLERVNMPSGLQVFIDYAHKPEALRSVLETLNEFKRGKIIAVFGCGGNRDALKRPLMASIAEQLSDYVVVTSDNPRGEDPHEIAHQIVQGFTRPNYCVELDRKKAIEHALAMASPNDLVLIAGKGHENYQVFANETIAFDDKEVVSRHKGSSR